MISRKFLPACLVLLLAVAGRQAHAVSITQTGTFTTDDQVLFLNFGLTSAQTVDFFTTSYGGGTNANGTHTSAGGFVPILTLFNLNGMGIAASGACGGSAVADPSTKICDDAFLSEALKPGAYVLALTEFPNAANPDGKLLDGFQFAGSPHITGDFCNDPGGTFLQTDSIPCFQRDGNYAVNIETAPSAVTPEPPSWLLVLPATGIIALVGRRSLA